MEERTRALRLRRLRFKSTYILLAPDRHVTFLSLSFLIVELYLAKVSKRWKKITRRSHIKSTLLLLVITALACRILAPGQGIKPVPLQWKCGVLTTGSPGKSLLFPSFPAFPSSENGTTTPPGTPRTENSLTTTLRSPAPLPALTPSDSTFYPFYFFPGFSLCLVQTLTLLHPISIASKLISLVATLPPGPEIIFFKYRIHTAALLKSLTNVLCQNHQWRSPPPSQFVLWCSPLVECPWDSGEGRHGFFLVCSSVHQLITFTHTVSLPPNSPDLLELSIICRWFNPRKCFLMDIFSHQMI